MEKATTLEAILKNFDPTPLTGDELDEKTGIYVDTIEARTGSEVKSPLRKLYNACTGGSANFIHVLMGHRGCGKSTEINKLYGDFLADGYIVKKIDCQKETNLSKIDVFDILYLILQSLLDIVEKEEINGINENNAIIIQKAFDYFNDTQIVKTKTDENTNTIEAGGGFNFLKIIKIFAEGKTLLQYSSETITTIKERIRKNNNDWFNCIDFLNEIIYADKKKRPIIIFENLDKIVPATNALKIFEDGYISSEKIRTYCIFTFPISLTYSPSIGRIESFFEKHVFPMIDVKTKGGKDNPIGIEAIKNIIAKRADLNLFEEEALKLLIDKTGGSLKDIFWCIRDAADEADYKHEEKVREKHIQSSLISFKSDITRRIVTGDYPALKKIHTDKTEIENREKMLEYLESHVILEYNCERWHDCHPLIWDFIKDKG